MTQASAWRAVSSPASKAPVRPQRIDFKGSARPTIGVELELGLVDAQTMELSSSIGPLLDKLPKEEVSRFKPTLVYLDAANRIARTANAIPVQAA